MNVVFTAPNCGAYTQILGDRSNISSTDLYAADRDDDDRGPQPVRVSLSHDFLDIANAEVPR